MNKKIFWIAAILLAWFGRDGLRAQQRQPVSSVQPDCMVFFNISVASSGAQAAVNSAGTSGLCDDHQVGAYGWTVAYTGLGTSGWPFRVRLEAGTVAVTAPSGHALAAPQLAAEANAWNPDKWVIAADDGLVIDRAGKGKVAIGGRYIRASVHGLTQRWPGLLTQEFRHGLDQVFGIG